MTPKQRFVPGVIVFLLVILVLGIWSLLPR